MRALVEVRPLRSFLFLLTFLLIGCEIPVATAPDVPPLDGALRAEMLQAVNDVRAAGTRCGDELYGPAPPLEWSGRVERAAQRHSEDMAAHDHYSHTGTDGTDAGDRLVEEGYRWRTWGENVAKNYPNAKAVVQAWLDSPGHCANLMKPKFKEMGVSEVDGYWTQVFATPR